ncbi:MAG TPA: hypothetical protein VFE91_02315 [Nitrososphaerales archaeon]|nr:hypothetical protein [Nitrososphaerales archaeon]
MRIDEGTLRFTVATLLASAAASIAFYLWSLDLFTGQRVFGTMLGAELIIFSMLVYVYYKPSISGSPGNWLLLGCLAAAAFVIVSIQLGVR